MKLDLMSDVKSVQPTLTVTTYSQGDAIGGLQSLVLTDEAKGVSSLVSLCMVDKAARVPGIDVLFYSQTPGGTITDNSALSVTAADHASYFLGRVQIASGDWASQVAATNLKDVTKLLSGLKLKCTDGTSKIYFVLLCTAAPSGAYAAGAGDLTVRLGVNQD